MTVPYRWISLSRTPAGAYTSHSLRPYHPCLRQTARTHHRCSEQGWVLDVTTIFAELDAFTQRCKDLIEICNCQMYLNRCGLAR